ncbi:hypothetical protein GCM10010168_14370 [Actinoplanes ianthinogenes]|uniref:DNRLRE domain-containing protein n=1 Tax=Actinoplanes ianthinogenes TaxID=122358 RepID=A0ABM7LZ67_9ACTN|nr:hypothetical protein [Actinoplanes ianthinogenes]BCJ44624.1 hypothetical protein Aiant_52810 [Actinoplanes ianthinogenes]GGQ99100.1 hypothetical protein GCM10010168_14370 [Actinoplanes ianthinogenes]
MKKAWVAALAAGLGVVLATPDVASAAWHPDSPPQVVAGWTDSAQPGKAFPTGNGIDLPLGTSTDDAGVTHTSRIYATFDLSRYEGALLTGGTVYVQEKSAADCTKRSIEIWRTKAVSTVPTWKKAPSELTRLDEIQTSEYCPTASIGFDVSAAIADAKAAKQRLVTFELRVSAEHEADPAYARKLNWYKTVQLSLSYNTVPKVDSNHLYTGGRSCTQLKPYPVTNFGRLQALVTDPDEGERITAEFAVWPVKSPDNRTILTDQYPRTGRVASVLVPEANLVQGQAYGWQARVSDGTETSAWSKKCFFTYDGTAPSAPEVTTTNYTPGTWGPVGEYPEFVFDGHGDKDIAGFQYSWNGLGVGGICTTDDEYGQLVCHDPFSEPRTVKASTPGGKVTIALNPDDSGVRQLTVRAIDLAGNSSPSTTYDLLIPTSEPTVTVEGGTPEWNKQVLLKITPAAGVTGVTRYEIERAGQDYTDSRTPDENGVAYYSFFATEAGGPRITVRSVSDDGFTSAPANWTYTFLPWPGVHSDVYDDVSAEPTGGVGVTGSFTFSPPPGWHEVASYRYVFDDWSAEPTVVPAGEDGRATITWTPETDGYHFVEVYAVKPDGTLSEYSNYYQFQVAPAA